MPSDTTVVFLHGSGLGAWIWEKVASRLGTPSLSIDFPNRGQGVDANKNLSIDDYADAVITQIDASGARDIVLVAHSIAGVVALAVAHRLKDRVRGFVGVSAAIPKRGGSYLSCLPAVPRLFTWVIVKLLGTRVPDEMIASALCNDLDAETVAQVQKRFTSEAPRIFLEKVNVGGPSVPYLYVRTTNDKAVPDALQQESIKALAGCLEVDLATGHLPMLADPDGLASALKGFLSKIR